ncbi:MAG: glycine betaine/L-proline ABC transporter ATP-binding protein, partial [Pseudomonadota bacterium]
MSQTPKIEVEGLFKVFGDDPDKALDAYAQGRSKAEIQKEMGAVIGVADANFTVNEGEIFVVMGLSGSGKSTLVRLLNRLIEPTRGVVRINGEDIVSASDEKLRAVRRENIAMVFQSFALMPHMTVIDNAAYGLKIAGVGKAERRERAATALAAVGLSANIDNYPDALSGGMRQRVGLARALAVNPDILLMVVAFSAPDPLIRAEMQDELLRLQDEQRRTIVFISHDLDEAIRIGDRIAIMEGGRIVQIGTPEEIINSPANDYVASFFRNVDVSQVLSVGEVAQKTLVTVFERPGVDVGAALERLDEFGHHYG